MKEKTHFIGIIFILLVLVASNALAATTTTIKEITSDNIIYTTTTTIDNDEFLLINLLTVKISENNIQSSCQFNPYNYKYNHIFSKDALNICNIIKITNYKSSNKIILSNGTISGYGSGNTTDLGINTIKWDGYGVQGPANITFTAQLDNTVSNSDLTIKTGITGIQKMKTRYTLIGKEVVANEDTKVTTIQETSPVTKEVIQDQDDVISSPNKSNTTKNETGDETKIVNDITIPDDNIIIEINDSNTTTEKNASKITTQLSKIPLYIYAIGLLLLLIIVYLILSKIHGGLPWDSNSKKAMNIHKKAEKAYRQGKHKKSKKLYEKANKIRYKF